MPISQQLDENTKHKWQDLLSYLHQNGKNGLVAAFSGGVDSSLLALAAREAGIDVRLLSVENPLISEFDRHFAKNIAQELGLAHYPLQMDALAIKEVAENSRERCYACKKTMLSVLQSWACERGIGAVAEGSNVDDMASYRPGQRAVDELGVLQPLREAALRKDEIRALARHFGLSNWQRPSSPCLASRFPYDICLTEELLHRVEQGEALLRSWGFTEYRLRCHGDTARIELAEEEWTRFFADKKKFVRGLKSQNFRHVVLDLEGLKSGGFDK